MEDEKTNSARKLDDGRYELKTVNKTANTETIIIIPEKDIKEQYVALAGSKKRIEDNISKLVKEITDYEQTEADFGGKYSDEDVNRFNELAQLADARNNIGNRREQISAARAMLVQNLDKMKKMEGVIPTLKR